MASRTVALLWLPRLSIERQQTLDPIPERDARSSARRDDDVAGAQRRDEHLLDIGEEALAVDRPVDQHRGVDSREPEAGDESGRAPVAVRNAGAQALAPRGAAAQSCHLGVEPSLVDEDQTFRIKIRLPFAPSFARCGDVLAVLLGRMGRLG